MMSSGQSSINCCTDCKERRNGCHAICERYVEQRRELDKVNKRRFRHMLTTWNNHYYRYRRPK